MNCNTVFGNRSRGRAKLVVEVVHGTGCTRTMGINHDSTDDAEWAFDGLDERTVHVQLPGSPIFSQCPYVLVIICGPELTVNPEAVRVPV